LPHLLLSAIIPCGRHDRNYHKFAATLSSLAFACLGGGKLQFIISREWSRASGSQLRDLVCRTADSSGAWSLGSRDSRSCSRGSPVLSLSCPSNLFVE